MLKKAWYFWLPLLLIIFPGFLALVFIWRFAVNIPYWDQWEFIPALRLFLEGKPGWLQGAWQPHVSHRLFLPKLVFLWLARQTNWNVLREIYLSYLLNWVYLLSLWFLYRRVSRRTSLWGFVPLAWLTFNLSQWENILWGWQLAIYLLMNGLVLTIYLLSLKRTVWVVVAAIPALVASLSFINGLLVWPVGLLLLLALKAERKTQVFWSATGIVTILLYFNNFPLASPSTPGDLFSFTALQFLLANIGAPLAGFHLFITPSVFLATLIGLFVLFSVLLILRHRLSSRVVSEADVLLGALFLISLASSIFITVGRAGFGVLEWSLGSRYITITSLGIISIYLLLLNTVAGNRQQVALVLWFSIFVLLLTGGQAAHTLSGYRMGQIHHDFRLAAQDALLSVSTPPEEVLERLYLPDVIRERTPYLREQSLSLFSE